MEKSRRIATEIEGQRGTMKAVDGTENGGKMQIEVDVVRPEDCTLEDD